MLTKVIKFIRDWKEPLISIPLGIAVWQLSPYLLTDVSDPTAPAGWGPIYIQKIFFAIAAVLIARGLQWIMLRLDSKTQFEFSNTEYENKLTVWQRSVLLYWQLSIYALVFVLALLSR